MGPRGAWDWLREPHPQEATEPFSHGDRPEGRWASGGLAGFSPKGGPEGSGAGPGFPKSQGQLVLLNNGQSPGERPRFTLQKAERRLLECS